MLVSIVICSHNSANTLDGAVYSALMQDFPIEDYEVLLVDDGSSDETVELASSYGKRHSNFRYLRLPLSIGNAAAREQGLQTARGKYFTSLEPDDALHPRMLAECVAPLEQGLADLSYCDYHEVALADSHHNRIHLDRFDPVGMIGRAAMLRLDVFRALAPCVTPDGSEHEMYESYVRASRQQPYRIAKPLYYRCRQVSPAAPAESSAVAVASSPSSDPTRSTHGQS